MIYTGNMDRIRTVDKMVLAFAEVTRENPAAKLVLVGAGDQVPHLYTILESRNLEDRARFTGLVPHSQIPQYLRAADVGLAYVADKIQYRNQPPLKTVEYLASGLPVIATDTPGNRRFVTDEQNGLLVRDTVEALTQGMARLMEDPDLCLQMADIARTSVERFSYERIVAQQLLPFYKRCLAEAGAA